METSVVLVNPKEFGIEESRVNELIGNLPQIQQDREVLKSEYEEVVKMEIEDPQTAKLAREIRIKIRDNRTKEIAVWHKTTKDASLKIGQYLDAVKRREEAINKQMEDTLEEIEKYAENLEKARFEALMNARLERVHKFNAQITLHDVRQFNDELFEVFLSGIEKQYNDKIEAERLEAERIAEERRIEAERIEAQRIENERLKAEAEKARLEAEKLERKRQAELKAEREKAEAERKRLADIQAKKDAEQAEILRIEREKQAKLEAELKAKKDAELKIEQDRIEAERIAKLEAEKLAKAPIKNQMKVWINSFELPTTNLSNEVVTEIKEKFEAFKKWSESQITKF